MSNSLNQNPWQNEYTPSQQPPPMPKVAPPPLEAAIRTMASDIVSMAQSGGGPPIPQSVTLPSFKEEARSKLLFMSEEKGMPAKRNPISSGQGLKYLILAILILLVAVAIFFGSYYVLYPFLYRLKSSAPAVTPKSTSSTATSTKAISGFEHHSFFKQTVDGIFVLKIASSSAGFQAGSQQLKQSLAGLAASSTFFEIQPLSLDSQPLSASDFFASINANILDRSFLDSSFNQDSTLFLYKDESGLWPGYIFQLKVNQTPFLSQSNTTRIESGSSNWENLFLQSPGFPAGVFQDAIVSGQPVRILNFSDAKSVFAYGWFFNKYLIISTSLDGLKQAIQRF